jgi:hypothetical protein
LETLAPFCEELLRNGKCFAHREVTEQASSEDGEKLYTGLGQRIATINRLDAATDDLRCEGGDIFAFEETTADG